MQHECCVEVAQVEARRREEQLTACHPRTTKHLQAQICTRMRLGQSTSTAQAKGGSRECLFLLSLCGKKIDMCQHETFPEQQLHGFAGKARAVRSV